MEAVKAGRRNAAKDQEHIDKALDHLVQAGGQHPRLHPEPDADQAGGPSDMDSDNAKAVDVLAFGGTVKALGNGRLGGQLVRVTPAGDYDLTGDRFTAETNFGTFAEVPVYYNHAQDAVIGKRVLATAKLTRNEAGVWAETQLALRDDYEKEIYRLAEAGKLGWSSGSVAHLVERQPEGKGCALKSWPIAEASLTPTPAEPRNGVIPIKALVTDTDKAAPAGAAPAPAGASVTDEPTPNQKENIMSEDIKALADSVAALGSQLTEIKAKLEAPALPALPAQVKSAEPERPFKNMGEQLFAIRDVAYGTVRPDQVNRLEAVKSMAIKATGANELVQSEGGFLLQSDFASEVFQRSYQTGALTSRCRKQVIGGQFNGLRIPAIDEQSRADGSRFGGLRAYWQAEASTFQKSKPLFRQVVLELKKLIALVYATDELLADSAAFESYVMQTLPLEIGFKMDDAIINGLGGGLPLGILNAPATVSVAKEAGQAAATLLYANIVKMWARMWAGGQGPNIIQGTGGSMSATAWFVNQDVMPQLFSLQFPVGTAGIPAFLPPSGASGQPYSTLFGRPVIPVEQCATLGTVGDIILADLSQYVLADKGGLQAATSIHVQFLTDETAFRWTYRADGQPLWNTALTPYKGTSTLSPFVTLATRA